MDSSPHEANGENARRKYHSLGERSLLHPLFVASLRFIHDQQTSSRCSEPVVLRFFPSTFKYTILHHTNVCTCSNRICSPSTQSASVGPFNAESERRWDAARVSSATLCLPRLCVSNPLICFGIVLRMPPPSEEDRERMYIKKSEQLPARSSVDIQSREGR